MAPACSSVVPTAARIRSVAQEIDSRVETPTGSGLTVQLSPPSEVRAARPTGVGASSPKPTASQTLEVTHESPRSSFAPPGWDPLTSPVDAEVGPLEHHPLRAEATRVAGRFARRRRGAQNSRQRAQPRGEGLLAPGEPNVARPKDSARVALPDPTCRRPQTSSRGHRTTTDARSLWATPIWPRSSTLPGRRPRRRRERGSRRPHAGRPPDIDRR